MRIVFTGASGSGKTTIINKLGDIGFDIVEEQARILIKDYILNNPDLLPWNNRVKFQEIVEELQMKKYLENENAIFDRGIVDEIAYRRVHHLWIPFNVYEFCAEKRYDLVFMFFPYEELYENNNERIESFGESSAIFQYNLNVYHEMNYDIISVPNASIEERVEFIKKEINNYKNK